MQNGGRGLARSFHPTVFIVLGLILPVFAPGQAALELPPGIDSSASAHPGTRQPVEVFFTENRGQVEDGSVRFQCMGDVPAVFTPDAVVYMLRGDRTGEPALAGRHRGPFPETPGGEIAVFRVSFEGQNRVEPRGRDRLPFDCNFFLGSDPAGWRSGVAGYRSILYPDIYDGIDLWFRSGDGGLKYEFVVWPGAGPDRIRLRYEGAGIAVEDGTLRVETPVGTITDGGLYAYQTEGGRECRVPAAMAASGGVLSFCARYDQRRPLVIDPLIYSTFLGGAGDDRPRGIAVDGSGNLFLTGSTTTSFPTTPGVYRETSGGNDIFVAKLNGTGSSLVYSTFVGGRNDSGEDAWDIALDASGCAHVTGSTFEPDFPTTAGAFNRTFTGEQAFAFKLSADGAALDYSTFLGGTYGTSRNDSCGRGIAVGRSGDAYICGYTRCGDFPTTAGAYDRTINGGYDAFVAVLDPTGSRTVLSTFIGGAGYDAANDLAVGDDGDIYLTGITRSLDFPVTPGALLGALAGRSDAFISKLAADGTGLAGSTFFGGQADDAGFGIALGAGEEVYVSGHVVNDGFIIRLDSGLGALGYYKPLGGSGDEALGSLAVDSAGHAYATGQTLSLDLPVTPDAVSRYHGSGYSDAWLVKLDPRGNISYCSYLGGSGQELAGAVALAPSGHVFVAGATQSSEFPVTAGAFDRGHNGGLDGFAMELLIGEAPSAPGNLSCRTGDGYVNLSWDAPAKDGGLPMNLTVLSGPGPAGLSPLGEIPANRTWFNDTAVENGRTYSYAVRAANAAGENRSSVVNATPGLPPSAPTGLKGTGRDRSVDLGWRAPYLTYHMPVLSYNIYRSVAGSPMELAARVCGTSLEYTDSQLSNGVGFNYSVSAENIIGEGPRSESVEVVPFALPGAPADFRAVYNDQWRCAFLSYREPADDGGSGIVNYSIYKGEGDSGELGFLLWTGDLHHTDYAISRGGVYRYAVSPNSGLGEGNLSEAATVLAGAMPGPPRAGRAVLGNGTVVLSWEAPEDDGGFSVDGYRIRRRAGDSGGARLVATVPGTGFRDTDILAGVRYSYEISAVTRVGEGPAAAVDATPFTLPSRPREPATGIEGRNVTIGWLPPEECGSGMILGYSLQVWLEGAGPMPLRNVNDTRARDVIAPGELRRYRVAAFNEFGTGEFSDEVTAALPVAAIGADRAAGNLSTDFRFESRSSDPDGRIIGWNWDFGDGQAAPGASVTHRYARRGNFTVNLTVRDNSGGIATASTGIRVENRPPVLTGAVPRGTVLNLAVTGRALRFAVCATDPDGDLLSYLWLIDGAPAGAGDNCSFIPNRTGAHTILVRVLDGEAAVERAWEMKVAEPPVNAPGNRLQPPVAAILAGLFLAGAAGFWIRRRRKAGRPAG